MIAAPAAAESRTTATGPMPILSDIAPLLMGEGEVVPDELDVVPEAVAEGDVADTALPVLVLVPVDVDVDDIDVVEVVVVAVTEKSPLVA